MSVEFDPTPKRTKPRKKRLIDSSWHQLPIAPDRIEFRVEATSARQINFFIDHFYATDGGYSLIPNPKSTFGVTMSQTSAINLAHLILSALKEASDGHNH